MSEDAAPRILPGTWQPLAWRWVVMVLVALTCALATVAWTQYNDVQTLKLQMATLPRAAAAAADVAALQGQVALLQYQAQQQGSVQTAIQAQLTTIIDKLGVVQSSVARIEGSRGIGGPTALNLP